MAVAAVDLDDDPLLAPKRVDGVGADVDVYLRKRQPVAAAEVEEQNLEVALGAGEFGTVKRKGPAKLGRPGPADAGHLVDRGEVEVLPEIRLLNRLADVLERRHRSEVEQSSRNGRHRQALVHDAVEAFGSVDASVLKRPALAGARNGGDLGQVGEEFPPMRGARVTQCRSRSRVEDSGE